MSALSSLARRMRLTPYFDPSLIIRDVAYFSGTNAHVNHKLDIFLPSPPTGLLSPAPNDDDKEETAAKKVPIVVHVHGGGWIGGDRANEWIGGPSVGRTCAKQGFVGVVASYRLTGVSLASFLAYISFFGLILLIISFALRSWQLFTGYIAFVAILYMYQFLCQTPASISIEHMVDDLCRAVVYVRDHICDHYPHADPEQIFISGHSAGAHLATLLVLDPAYFERHQLSLSSIRGVISISGVYSLTGPAHDSRNHFRNLIFRTFYASNLVFGEGKTCVEYSPIEYIHENRTVPPFLVMSARFDMGLQVDARRFVQRLRQSDHSVEYHVIGGITTHGSIISKFPNNDTNRHFFAFIRQRMRRWVPLNREQ